MIRVVSFREKCFCFGSYSPSKLFVKTSIAASNRAPQQTAGMRVTGCRGARILPASASFLTLSTAAQLGPYQILGLIGAGGMGEVYKARYTRLDRIVAVKVLPAEISADHARRARFEREAKMIAGLNHPHICTLHDVGEHSGSMFLVMEFLEGETLADRIARGPLSVDEALKVCGQIAQAVEAAHDKGIIHRDLKPANVTITSTGDVKVLDFGLAKTLHEQRAPADSQTISQVTRPDIILGTAPYMSPEQANGQQVDRRADIWAFGWHSVRMPDRKKGFSGRDCLRDDRRDPQGRTRLGVGAEGCAWNGSARCAALSEEGPEASLPRHRRYLARHRQSGDGYFATRHRSPATGGRTDDRGAAVLLLAGVLIGRALTTYFRSAPVAPVVSSAIQLEPGHWLDGMRRPEEMQRPSRTAIDISRDGTLVVYSAIDGKAGGDVKPRLFLRRMAQLEAKPIIGAEGGINPFFSPDANWVGFWAEGKLKKIPVEGGVATPLCDVAWLFGATWGDDNSIVFADGDGAGLSRVLADGGEPETLTRPDPKREEKSHRLPSYLPGAKALLFTAMRHGYDSHPWIGLLRLDTRDWDVLLRDAADARYVATGHLVFLRQGTIMAVRLDAATRKIIGQPVALVDGVMQAFSANSAYNTGAGQFSISDTGSLVYAGGGVVPPQKNSLVWVDHSGGEQAATALRFPFFAPRLSPDGRKVAYIFYGQERHLWVHDLDRGTNTPLTDEGMSSFPTWHPDGRQLLFGWQKSVRMNLFQQPFDGSSPITRVTTSDYDQRVGSWSSDASRVAMVEAHQGSGSDIYVLDTRSGRTTAFVNSKFEERYPEFSPNNRWIAYTSDESSRSEVYVQPVSGSGRHQVSTDGGTQPIWARNGRQLFYRWQDQVWAVDVTADGDFAAGKPRLLFSRSGYSSGAPIRGYDLSLDSRRFLMVKLDERTPSPLTGMVLIQNWLEELKRKVQ